MEFKIPHNSYILQIKKPEICFITMCKNEEHCILKTLESVVQFIDYWVICDTGSTDKTCELITNFFKEKNIPGELFHDEWKGFDINKTLLFERAYSKSKYVFHIDADDILMSNISKERMLKILNDSPSDKYYFKYKRGTNDFRCTILYLNNLKWKYIGVAHNIIVCTNKEEVNVSDVFINEDIFVDNNERGSRMFDPEKYLKDALLLKEQFFETLIEDEYSINNRSIFYTARSYKDAGKYKEALQWFKLYTKVKDTWNEEEYESELQIGHCMIFLKFDKEKIKQQFDKTIKIFPDRAEAYYSLGKYLNDNSDTALAYDYLLKAKEKNFEHVLKKYKLFVNKYNYSKFVNDELSVSCYWTGRFEEGYSLLMEIIDDPEFESHRSRLLANKEHFDKSFHSK